MTMVAALFSRFRRKTTPPVVCSMHLDDPGHVHGPACFVEIQPLSVVELFQSQGCQACPPAVSGILEGVKSDPNSILLTYNVTYFDYLGWPDTRAKKQWDIRQRAYVSKWGRNMIFTPMVVVDGMADGTGVSNSNEVRELIANTRDMKKQKFGRSPITLETDGAVLKIDSAGSADEAMAEMMADTMTDTMTDTMANTMTDTMTGTMVEGEEAHANANGNANANTDADADEDAMEAYDVILISYEPKSETVKVAKGPNKGKKLEHRNLVKSITKIGEWKSGHAEFPLPAPAYSGTENLVILQAGPGGHIAAAQNV